MNVHKISNSSKLYAGIYTYRAVPKVLILNKSHYIYLSMEGNMQMYR